MGRFNLYHSATPAKIIVDCVYNIAIENVRDVLQNESPYFQVSIGIVFEL